jgi:N-acetylglucosaminyl-diphospho-decaprenol L-rhamnosyltransferase
MTRPCAEGRVAAVVVAHNSAGLIAACLSSLAREQIPAVVVDCGSSDDSAEIVARAFPEVALIRTSNVGFGRACNLGISATESEFVLVLNADAWPRAGAVAPLVREAGSSRVGAAGPRLVSLDGREQRSVIRHPVGVVELVASTLLPTMARAAYLASRLVRGRGRRTVRSREFLMGAALLLRREALDEVGVFDADFFMYDEDVDLCHRLTRARWTVRFVPEATFVHVGGASSEAVAADMRLEQLRSHIRYIAKHRGVRAAGRARIALAAALWLRACCPPRGDGSRVTAAGWLLRQRTPELLGLERS